MLNAGFIAVGAGALATLVLIIINIVIAAKTEETSKKVTFAIYIIGILTVIINLIRCILIGETAYVITANVVVAASFLISLRRICTAKDTNKNETISS